jgi:Tfp pilus assembly protein PilE
MTRARRMRWRLGFTIIEIVMALGVVAVIMLVVAQVAAACMLQRLQTAARRAALEQAANVLETARALPVEQLTETWAEAQQLTPGGGLPEASRLHVRVGTLPVAAGARRVTVAVLWRLFPDEVEQRIELVGLFAPRSAAGKEP